MEDEVTPWSVAPEALPPWQAFATVPKEPPAPAATVPGVDAVAVAEACAEGADGALALGPTRLQPAANSAANDRAARVLTVTRTGSSSSASLKTRLRVVRRHTPIVTCILRYENVIIKIS
jgi:hypothetical protein